MLIECAVKTDQKEKRKEKRKKKKEKRKKEKEKKGIIPFVTGIND